MYNYNTVSGESSHCNHRRMGRGAQTPPRNFHGQAEIHASFGKNINISQNNIANQKIMLCPEKFVHLVTSPPLANNFAEKY